MADNERASELMSLIETLLLADGYEREHLPHLRASGVEWGRAEARASAVIAAGWRHHPWLSDSLTWCGRDHPGGCSVPDSTGVCEIDAPPYDLFDAFSSFAQSIRSVPDATDCTCGWGGTHDPDNPRCAAYRPGSSPNGDAS